VALRSTGGSHPTRCLAEAGNCCPHRHHRLSPSRRAALLIPRQGTGVGATLPAAATLQQVQEGALHCGGVACFGGRLVEAGSSCLNGTRGREEGKGSPLQWGQVSKIYLKLLQGMSVQNFFQSPPVAEAGLSIHRMVGVGRDLCGSPSPTLLSKQGHLQ